MISPEKFQEFVNRQYAPERGVSDEKFVSAAALQYLAFYAFEINSRLERIAIALEKKVAKS